jgi:hypothetical protein
MNMTQVTSNSGITISKIIYYLILALTFFLIALGFASRIFMPIDNEGQVSPNASQNENIEYSIAL